MKLLEEGQHLGVVPNDVADRAKGCADAVAQEQAAIKIRELAHNLETGGNPRSTMRHAVKIKMPAGSVIEVGGECLVTALSNGGQPVEG